MDLRRCRWPGCVHGLCLRLSSISRNRKTQENATEKAGRLAREGLHKLGWTETDPGARAKGDRAKAKLAVKPRAETPMTLEWIAARLQMGTCASVSNLLTAQRQERRCCQYVGLMTSFIQSVFACHGGTGESWVQMIMRTIWIACIGWVAMAAVAWAGEDLKVLPVAGEVFRVEGRAAFLILPKDRAVGRPTPWVWYAPTLPGLPGPEERWMFEKFLGAGIGIAGLDVGESYGSPAGRALYSKLHGELVGRRAMASKACLLARSRGGLMLYSWACENPGSVACIAGIYPVCDLTSYPGLDKACGAYGLTAAELGAGLVRYNPMERLGSLARAKVPIFHIHGDVDVTVPLEKNSGELARRYRALGGRMELVVPAGQGHNMWPGFFECKELVEFVIQHARATGGG
jgi:hypothetical protein